MDSHLCSSLIQWLETFGGGSNLSPQKLSDGVVLAKILNIIAPEYFTQSWLKKIKVDVGDNWRLKLSNLQKIHEGVIEFFYTDNVTNIQHSVSPDLKKISEFTDEKELGFLLQLVLGCAINCKDKEKHIEAIMKMEEGVQTVIVTAIKGLMGDSSGSSIDAGTATTDEGLPSFHPHMKSLMEQLETTSLAKDEMNRRCNEMDLQLSILTEERNTLKSENEKLLERVEILEKGGDIGSVRYSDLRKQVEGLQDELYKTESAREEYKSRVEELEKVVSEIMTKNEELQTFADEAKSLKDEVDALRSVNDKVNEYENTIELYKRRLEEFNDIKRQVKILEEKNSNYMENNLELEEEIKKTGTLRPQVELLRKQIADLHQKLADETKHKDKISFENKKLSDKLEAATQERDRIVLERFELQKNLEELKCSSSADSSSRSPSDFNDLDALGIVSPEIREKLMRLQHENRLLKKKVSEKGEESPPGMESMLSDLQERFDRLQQENRWSKNASSTSYEASFLPKKLQRFKRNLKWASESDLLILRKRSSIVSNSFTPNSPPLSNNLPLTTITQTHNQTPLVIRHIHEFKMLPPSCDSGCCRTSPSSCEGSEDSPYVSFSDYNTIDSGVSSMCRCITPTIPSIVEECTTYHVSDVASASLGGALSPVMMHSHPAHTINHRCCSPRQQISSHKVDKATERPMSMSSDSSAISSHSTDKHDSPITSYSVFKPNSVAMSPTPHNSPKLPHSRSKGKSQRHSARSNRGDSLDENTTEESSEVPSSGDGKLTGKRSKSTDKTRSKDHKHRINWNLDDARAVSNGFTDLLQETKYANLHLLSADQTSSGYESGLGTQSCSQKTPTITSSDEPRTENKKSPKSLMRNNPFASSIRRKSPFRRHSVGTNQPLTLSSTPEICTKNSQSVANIHNAMPDVSEKSHRSTLSHFFNKSRRNKKMQSLDSVEPKDKHVQIVTDSLFTHFMVSPASVEMQKIEKKQTSSVQGLVRHSSLKSESKLKVPKRDDGQCSSTSDLRDDLLEMRIATSAYGAPIVSSESFLSFGLSDFTLSDPSVAEYSSDREMELELNPRQFKLLDGRNPHSCDRKAQQIKNSILSKYWAMKLPSKKSSSAKISLAPKGIIKIRRKTARAVMAETVNTVFSFCTP